jgi:hypothetical protein
MQTTSPQEQERKVAAYYRIFLVLWLAILTSCVLLVVLAVALGSKGTPNATMSYALLALGFVLVITSLVLKQQISRKAIETNNVAALQSAHIVGLALCESSALFGLLDRMATNSQTSWFLFGIAFIGMLLHFPRKEPLRAASFKPNLNV